MEGTYDVVIIGAGPIGLACGIEAKKLAIDTPLLKKDASLIHCSGIHST